MTANNKDTPSKKNILLEAKQLSKRYGKIKALNGLDFKLYYGEVLAFIGPNGAGKSTAMKILTGSCAATSGSFQYHFNTKSSPNNHREDFRQNIGYLPENTPLYNEMRVIDYLDFMLHIRKNKTAKSLRLTAKKHRELIDIAIEKCHLTKMAHRRIHTLSKGYRQRVGIAQAIVHQPKLCILDEATSGLDPNQIAEIRHLVRDISRQHSVMLSTHVLQEVDLLADRILILHRGQCAAIGTEKSLAQTLPQKTPKPTLDEIFKYYTT